MANNCATNYAIRGSQKEIMILASTLNSMENRPNPYGRYWIGNLLSSLGLDCSKFDTRGTFSPNPMEPACMCMNEIDENESFSADEDGILRLSTLTANCRNTALEEAVRKKFPTLEFFYFTTDEFGQFHTVHDPEDLGGFYHFNLEANDESSYYYLNEYETFLKDFREACPGLEIPDDREYLSSDAFVDEFLKWRNADQERDNTYFYVAKTETHQTQRNSTKKYHYEYYVYTDNLLWRHMLLGKADSEPKANMIGRKANKGYFTVKKQRVYDTQQEMKRLPLKDSAEKPQKISTEKEELITTIKEYIGENGCVAFEHCYTPTFNAQMITDKEVILRFRIGRDRRSKIPLEEFDEGQLKNLIVEMVRYENHCRLRA